MKPIHVDLGSKDGFPQSIDICKFTDGDVLISVCLHPDVKYSVKDAE